MIALGVVYPQFEARNPIEVEESFQTHQMCWIKFCVPKRLVTTTIFVYFDVKSQFGFVEVFFRNDHDSQYWGDQK